MNKLLACALLSFGLVQSVVACSDDDDNTPGGTAGSGAEGGTDQAGKGSGGSSAGSSSAGKSNGGTSNGGSSQAGGGGVGQGGKAGAAQGGTSGSTSVGGAGGDEAVGGADDGAAGGGGEGGASDVPTKDPQIADDYWLSKYCDAKAKMTLGCTGSPEWAGCYGPYSHYLSAGGDGEGICTGEPTGANQDEIPNTEAMIKAIDALAAACPLPITANDWQCDLQGSPIPKDKACRDAESAALAAAKTCGL